MQQQSAPPAGLAARHRAVVGVRGLVILLLAGGAGALTAESWGMGAGLTSTLVSIGSLHRWLGD